MHQYKFVHYWSSQFIYFFKQSNLFLSLLIQQQLANGKYKQRGIVSIYIYACLDVHTYVDVWCMWKLHSMNPKLETCISTLHLSIRLYNLTPFSVKALSLVPLGLLLLTNSFITFPEQPSHVVSSTRLVKLKETTLKFKTEAIKDPIQRREDQSKDSCPSFTWKHPVQGSPFPALLVR